jgi:hypothetical protein
MKNRISLLGLSIILLTVFIGCKKTYTTNNQNNIEYQGSVTDSGVVVTNVITSYVKFSTMQMFQSGTKMKIRLNRNGFEVREYNATFLSATTDGGEQLIYCSIPGVVIGSGDSGSPLLTADGNIAGALCYGWDGDNHQFAARAIEDLLSISSQTKSGLVSQSPLKAGMYSLAPAYQSKGLSAEFINRYVGRDPYNILSRYAATANSANTLQVNTLKSGSSINFIPGMSASVLEINGDLILTYSTGTLSYIDKNNNMYAFGHHYNETYPPLAAPVVIADTKLFIESNTSSFKFSDLTNYFVGSLTVDNYYGVLFQKSVNNRTFTSRVALKFYTGDSIVYKHSIANNTNIGYEYGLASYVPSYAIYFNRNLLQGKYVNVSGKIVTKSGILTSTDNISFNTLTSTVDLDLNDVLTDKFSKYNRNIDSQTISLSLTTATYADSVLVPIAKK